MMHGQKNIKIYL